MLLQEGCDKVYYKSSSGCRAIKPREVLHGPGVHAGGRGFAKVEGHVGGARGAGAGRRASRPSRSRTLGRQRRRTRPCSQTTTRRRRVARLPPIEAMWSIITA